MNHTQHNRWCPLILAMAWIMVTPCACAQSGTPPGTVSDAGTSAAPVFEVATVKPTAPDNDGHVHINYPAGGGFSASNISLAALLQWAYGLPQKQIVDGPPWLSSTRFDFHAKSDAETDAMLRSLPGDRSLELKRRMVQALLADRFALRLHRESRMLPAYDLVQAKGGSKLAASHADGKSIGVGRTHFNGQGLTLALIAQQLSEIAGRVVVDKTDLPGRYDLQLQWTPDDAIATDNTAPSLFTAVEEQLGLQLKSAKELVPVLVIDHVEAPSPN